MHVEKLIKVKCVANEIVIKTFKIKKFYRVLLQLHVYEHAMAENYGAQV